MAAETSEASKDQHSESATGENNTCTCTCMHVETTRACARAEFAIWSVQKNDLDSWKSTWIVGRALGCASSISYATFVLSQRVHPELDGRTLPVEIVHSLFFLIQENFFQCFSTKFSSSFYVISLAKKICYLSQSANQNRKRFSCMLLYGKQEQLYLTFSLRTAMRWN